jgi:hypothetical protein
MINRLMPYQPNRGLSAKLRSLPINGTLILAPGTRRNNLCLIAKNAGFRITYKTLLDHSILLTRIS